MLTQKQTLTLEAANSLIAFALLKANELKVGGAIAVVDEGGHLIALQRIDGSIAAASKIAIGKAETSMVFKRPGAVLEQTIANDRPAMATLNGIAPFSYVPLMGSYPIEVGNEMVGAIAVAGAGDGANDEAIVLFALEKFKQMVAKNPWPDIKQN